jgi:hypothetical protein
VSQTFSILAEHEIKIDWNWKGIDLKKNKLIQNQFEIFQNPGKMANMNFEALPDFEFCEALQ